MEQHEAVIAATQEPKLSPKVNFIVNNYAVVRRDRANKQGGGLLFIIHKSVQHREVALPPPTDNNIRLEQLAIADQRAFQNNQIHGNLACKKQMEINICPDCNVSPHHIVHLFNCAAKSTNLTVKSVLRSSTEVATFLELETYDDDDDTTA